MVGASRAAWLGQSRGLMVACGQRHSALPKGESFKPKGSHEMISDYAQESSPCCDAILWRPRQGGDSGRFFCKWCGKVWDVITFEGKSKVVEAAD
jgi:hypothetical protein